MLGTAENTADGIRRVDNFTETFGVRVEQQPTAFELSCDLPGGVPIYYRVGYGRLEWGTDLAEFETDKDEAGPRIEPGGLLALARGLTPPPDTTSVPGIRRLAVGTRVRVDANGVTISRYSPVLPSRRRGLVEAVGEFLSRLPDGYAIAYSGGVSSAFLAISALEAGHRPRLLHADLGPVMSSRTPTVDIPGLKREDVAVDLSALLDHHRITGAEIDPPLPDIELPRRIVAQLAEASGGSTVVSAALLKELASARLAEAGAGVKGWRLLSSEPFHVTGSHRSLRAAREFMNAGKVGTELAPEGSDRPESKDDLPGLTEAGREAMRSVRRSTSAVWMRHLDELPSVIGRLDAGVQERGLFDQTALPASDPHVLATLAALAPSKLGGIRKGTFHNHLLLRRALAAHNVTDVPETTLGFRTRLAAAVHLHRERDKVITELTRECALADLGLIEPGPVVEILRDGKALADHALTILRMVWIDQWLRGR